MSSSLDFGNKKFAKKQEIKPWLDHFLAQNGGASIIIERSDRNKIVFKCKAQKGRSRLKLNNRSRRTITCPFKIRANYSVRNSCWALVVLNDVHNHELEPPSSGATTPDKANRAAAGPAPRVGDTSAAGSTPDKAFRNDKLNDLSYLVLNELDPEKPGLLAGEKRSVASLNNGAGKRQRKPKQQETEEVSFDDELVKNLAEQMSELIKHHVSMNYMLSEDSKANIIRGLLTSIIQEHKDVFGSNESLKPQSLNSWFSSTATGISNNPSANLIPLAPLLNDSGTEYHNSSTNNAASSAAIDSLTLPVIGSSINGAGSSGSIMNTFAMPGAMAQIQNQSQQLPSFNSIQNNLPTSPSSMVSSATASLFSSTASGSSSILPINNTINTLNPSHLFKTSKNTNNALNNLLNLDLKQVSVFPAVSGATSVNNYLSNFMASAAPNVPASTLGVSAYKNHDVLKLRHDSDNE